MSQRLTTPEHPTPTADINSLPEELLAVVIQHLPWRDRLRVEGVNSHWHHTAFIRGWAHVRHISSADYAVPSRPEDQLNYAPLSSLLVRCAPFVESIQLTVPRSVNWPGVENLLDRCPKLMRIALRVETIAMNIVDYLRVRFNRSDLPRLE